MTIAAFDFYEIGEDVEYLLELEPTDPVSVNFDRLGFGSLYFIDNMGTLMIWPIFLISSAIFIIILERCHAFTKIKSCGRLTRLGVGWLKYSALITFTRESFIIILLCALISLPIISFKTYGLVIQSSSTIFFLSTILLWPITLYCILAYNFYDLQQPDLRKKYGEAYKELNVNRKRKVLLWPCYFYVRRIIFAIAIMHVKEHIAFQVQMVAQSTIASVILFGFVKPHNSFREYQVELLNEICVMLATYTVFCFTSFIQDAEVKMFIGYFLIALMSFHFIIGVGQMCVNTIKIGTFRLKAKKVLRKYEEKRLINLRKLADKHEAMADRLLLKQECFVEESRSEDYYEYDSYIPTPPSSDSSSESEIGIALRELRDLEDKPLSVIEEANAKSEVTSDKRRKSGDQVAPFDYYNQPYE